VRGRGAAGATVLLLDAHWIDPASDALMNELAAG
jgi:hypothetical protein